MRPILIVEDNDQDLELLLIAMEIGRLVNPVIRVRDGQEALDYLLRDGAFITRMEQDPAFVLLDLKMPRVSGFDVLVTVRESEKLRYIPIIALTGSAQERDIARAYDLGVNGYVVKPVEFSELVQAANAIVGMWTRHNETPPRFRS
ncbi:response regulator [Paraburkholderia tropica]|uniref:response regulator n=1 Tax=Paraburkholderia tropica TaxID=92647 RepID=UPI002AB5E741|nr:response regulator [Paraburkholderia tropica]